MSLQLSVGEQPDPSKSIPFSFKKCFSSKFVVILTGKGVNCVSKEFAAGQLCKNVFINSPHVWGNPLL